MKEKPEGTDILDLIPPDSENVLFYSNSREGIFIGKYRCENDYTEFDHTIVNFEE